MTKLSYLAYGKGRVSIDFACDADAKCIADELIDVPGIVDIKVDNKFWGKPHFKCAESYFQHLEDAVRFMEQQKTQVIIDLWTGDTYTETDFE